jgi:hypothetical protein
MTRPVRGEVGQCSFCLVDNPEFTLPLDTPFSLQLPGTPQAVTVEDDWPVCESCVELISRRYFRQLAERLANERLAVYQAQGEKTIERTQSVSFFVRLMGQLVPHIDTTRDIYPNPGWRSEKTE